MMGVEWCRLASLARLMMANRKYVIYRFDPVDDRD